MKVITPGAERQERPKGYKLQAKFAPAGERERRHRSRGLVATAFADALSLASHYLRSCHRLGSWGRAAVSILCAAPRARRLDAIQKEALDRRSAAAEEKTKNEEAAGKAAGQTPLYDFILRVSNTLMI